MAPSRVVGVGLAQSSPSSGLYFQGDIQSQGVINSHFSSSFGNSTSLLPGTGRASGDVNNSFFNSVVNSGPSVGASSLVTDANSGISGGGPHLQRSTSINTDSYMRLPASPMSFSSNNISISGSSVIDGSSVVQQDQSSQVHHGQQQNGASSATSFPTSTTDQISLPMSSSFIPEPNNMFQVNKKPRLDIKQEDILRQQVIQQLLQKPESLQLQSHNNPQVQALLQQERLRQQQLLQSMPPMQRAQLQQQQQQLQLRQQMQQQSIQQPLSSLKRPSEGGVCSRRLMQYLYHQRQRPSENTIAYWRKFVAEYYSPRAKKRWCLSSYDNVGQHALGVFPQAAMDAWQCDICGSKSGRGFEATFGVLPRLNEIKFGSGVIDELLFIDFPHECRFPSGIMMLEYGKAVQETIYEQLRVVREGHLRIIFTQDLKILSWEFCVRRHEELLPRKLVAPQVNQLVQVAQKCQNTISESGPDGVSQQDLQANSNMVLTAGRQLARSLELQSLNDLGFSKRYVRCLQISEVVNSMKDLIDFCSKHKAGPIDGLKNYPRHASAAKLQMQKMQVEQLASVQQGLPTDRNTLNKLMAMNNNHSIINRGPLNGSAQAALALSNYQNLLRQNSMNSNANSPQQEPSSSSFNNTNPNPSPRHSGSLLQAQPSQSNQALQQHMIQQLLMSKNNGPGMQQQQSLSGHITNAVKASPNVSGGVLSHAPSRSNSFKATSNSESSAANGNFGSNQKAVDLPPNLHVPEDMVQDIAREFTGDDDFFNSDFDDNMGGFGWKA